VINELTSATEPIEGVNVLQCSCLSALYDHIVCESLYEYVQHVKIV
jgi:hypothetical protein